MLRNVNVIVYQYQDEKYIDFKTIRFVCSQKGQEQSMHSKVWRYLRKQKYSTINYNNKKLYSLTQLLGDSTLVAMMQRAEELLTALKEDSL